MTKVAAAESSSMFENLTHFFRKCVLKLLSTGAIPRHIAFIMDGNRRYAKHHNLNERFGHRAGFSALTLMLTICYELGVKYVTIYAFSIDNFKRSPKEVQYLMDLMQEKMEELIREESILHRFGIRVHFSGDLSLLSKPVRDSAKKVTLATAKNSQLVLSIFMAYTSRNEIVNAVKESCKEKEDELRFLRESGSGYGLINPGKNVITASDVERHMYMAGVPDPDVIIRTSGETRLSNFLLWQSTWSLLYSPRVLWPAIGFAHLVWTVLNFQRDTVYLQHKKKTA